jgi:hypothetical protein
MTRGNSDPPGTALDGLKPLIVGNEYFGAKARPRNTVPVPAVAKVEAVLAELESVILKIRLREVSALVP